MVTFLEKMTWKKVYVVLLYTAELLTRSVDRIISVHICWLSKAILKSKPDRLVAKTFQSILQ